MAKLTASNGTTGDQLGVSAAIDGDTVVVGAWQPGIPIPSTPPGPGKVYVFEKSGASWSDMTQTAILTASDGGDNHRFGLSVAISGDTIVVGAEGYSSSTGAAYVFEKGGVSWSSMTETVILTATGGTAGDIFGHRVAINNNTIVVGARDFEGSVGAAYVLEKGASWQLSARLTGTETIGEQFGSSVAINGDSTIVVGARGARNGPTDPGAAYLFEKSGSGNNDWDNGNEDLVAKLTAADGKGGDKLGEAVEISGDTVVAGAPSRDAGSTASAGAVYVFVKGINWVSATQTAVLTASDGATSDQLGSSVAIDGNFVVTGSYSDNFKGAVYVFEQPNGWTDATETEKLTASDGLASDILGAAVAIEVGTIVAGAPGDNIDKGSAYIFDNDITRDLTISKSNNVGGNAAVGTAFSWALAISNTGTITASLANGQVIVTDNLPSTGATYGPPSAQNRVNLTGDINCEIAGNNLNCTANGPLSIGPAGRFEVTIPVTPTAPGSIRNPRSGGVCRVDPNGLISENDETNNDCNPDTVKISGNFVYVPIVLKD